MCSLVCPHEDCLGFQSSDHTHKSINDHHKTVHNEVVVFHLHIVYKSYLGKCKQMNYIIHIILCISIQSKCCASWKGFSFVAHNAACHHDDFHHHFITTSTLRHHLHIKYKNVTSKNSKVGTSLNLAKKIVADIELPIS